VCVCFILRVAILRTLYVYIHIHTHTHNSHTHTHTQTHAYTYIHIHTHIYIDIHRYTHIHLVRKIAKYTMTRSHVWHDFMWRDFRTCVHEHKPFAPKHLPNIRVRCTTSINSCHEPNKSCIYIYSHIHIFLKKTYAYTSISIWAFCCHNPNQSCSYIRVYIYQKKCVCIYIFPPENPCVVHYTHRFLSRTQQVVYIYTCIMYIYICIYIYMYISVCGTLHAPNPVTNPARRVHIHMYQYIYNTHIHV